MSAFANHQDRLETLACFLAPVAVAGVLALASLPPAPEVQPPRAAESSNEDAEPVQVTDRAVAQGEDADAIDAEVKRLLGAGEIASIFPQPQDEIETAPEPEEVAKPERPEFALTSVMSGRRGAMCVINQKVHQVGAEVAPGWRIAAIDAEARSVKLEGPRGESLTLTQGF